MGAGVAVGSLKGVATIVGIAVTGGIRTTLTTLGDTPVLPSPKQADPKTMVRTAAMAIPVLNPCCLLLSKAIFLFHVPVPATSKTLLVYKIRHYADDKPHPGQHDHLTTDGIDADGLMEPKHSKWVAGSTQQVSSRCRTL